MSNEKKLTHDDYLKCLGLHHLAKEHYKQSEAFDKAMNKILNAEWGSHASDSIYSDELTFDEALERMGIEVIPDAEGEW